MQTDKDLLSELIKRTDSGKHRQFQLLQNWTEYCNARYIRRTHRLLVSSIRTKARELFNGYCSEIKTGEADVVKLFAYHTLTRVLYFYEEELRILNDMIDEYECYLLAGNWLDFILSINRPADKQWDHRG